jgi:hypothetical protein
MRTFWAAVSVVNGGSGGLVMDTSWSPEAADRRLGLPSVALVELLGRFREFSRNDFYLRHAALLM